MSTRSDLPSLAVRELARRIDHTLLDPTAGPAEIERLCAEALEHGFAAVCVAPIWVPRCAARLQGSDVAVCSVVGFPLGAHLTEVKVLEARRALEQGAGELDLVGQLGALVAGDLSAFERDVAAVVAVAAAVEAPVKVILETARLEREHKVTGARLAIGAGAAFVKTSTGTCGGATVDDVRLLRETVGTRAGVKASGGIRSYGQARAMLEAGADRLGTSASVVLVREAAAG